MATSNKDMNDRIRAKRRELSEMPGDSSEEAEKSAEPAPDEGKTYKVAAPGEPSTGEQFEYEPMTDIPGAWVVYPPGVPCDDTEYRIQMDKPADKSDFEGMQKALEEAGATNPEPAVDTEAEYAYAGDTEGR